MHPKVLSYILATILIIFLVYLFIRQLEGYYQQQDPMLDNIREIFSSFFSQKKEWREPLQMLNSRQPHNEVTFYKGKKSYTINKSKVYICLKDENNEYYNLNMLIYVVAHEYAHVLSESIGHTDEFYRIFEALLVELTDIGYYDPSQEIIQDYCQY